MTFYDRDEEVETLERAFESPRHPVTPTLEDDIEDDVSLFDSDAVGTVRSAE